MNKMAKGALAIGVGAALLLGGGGTLAIWNDSENADAGTIAAGTLDLEAQEGAWTSNGTPIDSINTYKVVPGETLTYTQPLIVNLAGDKMKANLTVDTADVTKGSTFATNDLRVTTPTLKDSNGNPLPATLSQMTDEKVTASVDITFNADAQSSINATANLESVKYKLNQIAPAPTK